MDRLAALRRHQQELSETTAVAPTTMTTSVPLEPAASPSCASTQGPSAPPAINANQVEEMNMLLFNANSEICKLEIAVDEAFLPLHGSRRTSNGVTAEGAAPDSKTPSDQESSSNAASVRTRPPPISMPVTADALAEIDAMLLSLQFSLTRCKTLRDTYDAETQQLQMFARMGAEDAGIVDGHAPRGGKSASAAAASPPSTAELQMRCNISSYVCERLKTTMQRLWTVEERYHAARVEAAKRQLTIYFMKGHTGSGGEGTPDASTPEGKAVLQQLKRFNGPRVEVEHLEDVLAPRKRRSSSSAADGVGSDDYSEAEEGVSPTTPPLKAKAKTQQEAAKKKKTPAFGNRITSSYVNHNENSVLGAEDEAATQQVLISQLAEYMVNTRQDLQDGQGGIFCFTSCEQLYNSILENRMAVAEVEQNMEKLHRLFLDLHFCVMEQDEDIMKVLKNTQGVHEKAKRGRLEIKRGKKYYNKCGLCCTIM